MTQSKTPVLRVTNLSVAYEREGRIVPVLHDISLTLAPGDALAIVGESGCGKSTLAAAILNVLPKNARITGGTVCIDEVDITRAEPGAMRALRGTKIAMVSQEPGGALNPSMRIGAQVVEAVVATRGISSAAAGAVALDLLTRVAIRAPDQVMKRFPHQLSGGQQQRILIAMALAGNPEILVLDEPTTGLDATVEAEVIDLIAQLRREFSAAIVFVSHNLGLVSRVCERMAVLYAGRLVENGPSSQIVDSPTHPYSAALLDCVPRLANHKVTYPVAPIPGAVPDPLHMPPGCVFAPRCALRSEACEAQEPSLMAAGEGQLTRCLFPEKVPSRPRATVVADDVPTIADEPLLEVKHLSKRFVDLVACDDISFTIHKGETFGLVGESGSGKSTLARCVAGLTKPDSGTIALNGTPLMGRVQKRRLGDVRAVQMVFQSPEATLNPQSSIRAILSRAISRLRSGEARGENSAERLAEEVRLPPQFLDRKPKSLSGGQKQRVAIGRAFAGNPALVLCDEPVSALDMSVQAGILNLLTRLQREEGVSYLFISHDLGVVRYLADRIGVLYLGQMVEIGDTADIFGGPRHPYTEALLGAMTSLDHNKQTRAKPDKPTTVAAPLRQGCRFAARCSHAMAVCSSTPPPWRDAGNGHAIRCHLSLEGLTQGTEALPLIHSAVKETING